MGFDLGIAKALQSIGEQGQLGLGIGSQQGIGQHGMIKIRAISAYQKKANGQKYLKKWERNYPLPQTYTRSKMAAMPWPPPMHMVTRA